MLEEAHDDEQIIERVAALDIGKAEVVCCVRVPGEAGRRRQEVQAYSTMTRSLQLLADRLLELGVTRVVVEATSDYWKPPFYLLEAHGLAGQRQGRQAPARPAQERQAGRGVVMQGRGAADAAAQLRAPATDPPAADLTRYRIDLVGERTAEKNRVEKLLEDAQIKLSVVASDIFGVSGRAMMAALVAGERDPGVLAQLARTTLRGKISQLQEAFTGRFDEHHAFLLAKMLARVDRLNDDIADVDAKIEEQIAPFADAVARLVEIPGVGVTAARVLIAEIGTDMSRFPTPGHLASWARFAPVVNESAGRKKGSVTGRGNRYLARVLGECVVAASRTDTFLGQRYRRLVRRRGKPKAIVAVGRSILIIVWHLLAHPDAHFADLGPDVYDNRISNSRKMRSHIAGLEALGYKVHLEPAA